MLKNKNDQLTGLRSYLITVWIRATIKTQKEETGLCNVRENTTGRRMLNGNQIKTQ